MRPIYKMAGACLLVALAVACDSETPVLVGEQTLDLVVTAGAGSTIVPVVSVYDGFQDDDGDNNPDDVNGDGQPDFFLWCISSAETTANITSVPIGFTLEVTILREGQTVRELFTSENARDDEDENLTEYDTAPPVFGAVPQLPAEMVGGSTYRFTNGRRLSSVNRAVVENTATFPTAWGAGNPLTAADPVTYDLGNGLCSDIDPGPAVIDRSGVSEYPLRIVLDKGDTVTVKARRGVDIPAGITVLNPPNPSLTATLNRGGRPVSVRGASTSAIGPGEGFTFAFTAR